MIIATGTLNIDENAKLAQQASDDAKNVANSAADEAGKIKTSLDGKITVSSQEPFDDGKSHDEGDIWYVQDSNHITSEMYTYDGSDWVKTKMSQTALSVGQLSALSADLGTIEAGYLNSVEVDSSIIKGGSISGSSLSITNNDTNYWLDQNGLHVRYYADDEINGGNTQKDVWVNDSGLSISMSEYRVDIQPEQIEMSGGGHTGTLWSSNIDWAAAIFAGNIQINSGHVIHSRDYGDLYFEGGSDTGLDSVGIYASAFNKRSLLSRKNYIQNLSGDEAVAAISATDIKQFNYAGKDNHQQINIGPIIDDKHDIGSKIYRISENLLTDDRQGVSVDNEINLTMIAVKELIKENSELTLRVSQLERKLNNE
ncbi:hypothetical protein [Lentilactobacillus parabuchneri]|uniref:hypothetical protein n=1 Tax=Lentilactobacillus parabuchneri TaxID=152331 RepID=UPI000A2255AE|nr:hypothetical protein [Lentilactobacillus parabuchneri]ORN06580.1 hypothetical protein FAM23163_01759 [Lentilactobacillus parabuchneri]ORN20864.1 hypothetical protein FAM23168_01758 [Lentilactobacillus parabuchneri]